MREMRIKMIGLTAIAMLAISAIATAAASAALPEQVPASGTFTATSGKSTFETKSGEKVVCEEDKASGEITGAKTDKSTITFSKCEAFGLKCKSKGAASGEIVLKMNSELVYINKSKKEVGNILTLAEELTIECTVLQKLKVKGATLCPITPVNTKTKTFTLTCTETKGVQQPTEYENSSGVKVKAPITETKGEGLKSFAFEQSGLEGTDTLTFATESEIKA
jgi:hypothetical protein